MELIRKTNIDFMGARKIAFGVSSVLVLLGLVCIAMIAAGKANLGIDFAGGASADLLFAQPVQLETARAALDKAGFKDAEIQAFTGGTKLLVRVKRTDIPVGDVVERIRGALAAAFPGNAVTVDSSSAIGPTVGKALQKDALLAIALSMLGIIIYIWFRFEFRFGLAATVATFHDVLAVLGVFFVLHKEITLLVVTALLTLAGYSLTDTVVVFDRIRENLRIRQKDNLLDIINASVNEVLSRTIVTSMTAFLAVLALYVLGGEVLHDFAFAMMGGIIVGTYSSVFVASPLLYVWRGRKGGRLIKATMLTRQPVKPVLASSPPPVSPSPPPPPAASPTASNAAQAKTSPSAPSGRPASRQGKKKKRPRAKAR